MDPETFAKAVTRILSLMATMTPDQRKRLQRAIAILIEGDPTYGE